MRGVAVWRMVVKKTRIDARRKRRENEERNNADRGLRWTRLAYLLL